MIQLRWVRRLRAIAAIADELEELPRAARASGVTMAVSLERAAREKRMAVESWVAEAAWRRHGSSDVIAVRGRTRGPRG